MSTGPRAAGAGNTKTETEPSPTNLTSYARKMPNSIERRMFTYMGHGNELPIDFNERKVVPPGRVIVFFAEHARPVKSYVGNMIWAQMANEPDLFLNPLSPEFKEQRPEARVYLPGDKLPRVLYYPFLIQRTPSGIEAFQSGVYEINQASNATYALPIQENELGVGPKKFKLRAGVPFPIDEIVSGGANYELRDKIKDLYEDHKNDSFSDLIKLFEGKPEIKLDDYIDTIPKGIHYFMSCRMIKGQHALLKTELNAIFRTLQTFQEELQGNPANEGYRGNLPINNITQRKSKRTVSVRVPNKFDMILASNLHKNVKKYAKFSVDHKLSVETVNEAIQYILRAWDETRSASFSNQSMLAEEMYDDFLNTINRRIETQTSSIQSFVRYFLQEMNVSLSSFFKPMKLTRSRSVLQQRGKGFKTRRKAKANA